MLNKILSISLQNRLMVLLGAVVMSVAGMYIARNMNVDVFPDLTQEKQVILVFEENLLSVISLVKNVINLIGFVLHFGSCVGKLEGTLEVPSNCTSFFQSAFQLTPPHSKPD